MCTAVHFCNFCPFTSKKSGLRFVDWLSKMLYAGLSALDSDCRLLTHDCLHLPDFLQKYHFIQLSLGKAGHKRMLQDTWMSPFLPPLHLAVSLTWNFLLYWEPPLMPFLRIKPEVRRFRLINILVRPRGAQTLVASWVMPVLHPMKSPSINRFDVNNGNC